MEELFAFFHRGHLLTIAREAGERKVRYSTRVGFIVQRVGKYDLHTLEEYSRVYADMVLYGVEYPVRVTNFLGTMISMHKPVEPAPDQTDLLAVVQDILPGSEVKRADGQEIEFQDGKSIHTAEVEGAYLRVEPNIDIEGGIVIDVVVEKSDSAGEKEGLVIDLDVGGEDVRVQTCSNKDCTEPADVAIALSPQDEREIFKAAEPIVEAPAEFGLPQPAVETVVVPLEETVPQPETQTVTASIPLEETVPQSVENRSPRIERPQSPRLIIIEEDESVPACLLERNLPKPSRDLIMHRFDADLMRGALIEFKESILFDLFEAYNVGVFGGELGKAIREGRLKIEMKWTEDQAAPLASADISGILCTLILSKPLLTKMGNKCKGKHEIFGRFCATQFEVIMVLMESFCTLVAAELCALGARYAEFAKKLFDHEGTEQKISPPEDEIRLRIKNLKTNPDVVVKVTLKDGKEYTVAGARSLTEVLLNDGDDKKRVPYEEVTHINGEPV